ncbi:MAG: hypothetical protein JOZ62_03370 [Acidobacteriaceae bacterium]|nr:hypothetical protein [Acidobacteriaceae bacterium]
MAGIEYSLFRVNFIKPRQQSLLDHDLSSTQIFLSSVQVRPSAHLRAGQTWHIGNLQRFSDNEGYFAFGRTTKASVEKFDESSGNFLEEEQSTSPYTHCVFDARRGIVGIAKKTSLAKTSKGIAKRLQQLLSTTRVVRTRKIVVEIAPIPDPHGFMEAIRTAYRITRFAATFHGPNPFDADAYFQKPLSALISAANGEKGKAQLVGRDLDKDTLLEVSRSTAATGNEATAMIVKSKSEKPLTINLRGNAIKRSYDEAQHDTARVVRELSNLYDHIRND